MGPKGGAGRDGGEESEDGRWSFHGCEVSVDENKCLVRSCAPDIFRLPVTARDDKMMDCGVGFSVDDGIVPARDRLEKTAPFLFLAPLLSGIILVFAFPGWNSDLAVWVWLFPLLAVLWPWRDAEGVKVRPFWRGYLATGVLFAESVLGATFLARDRRRGGRLVGGIRGRS